MSARKKPLICTGTYDQGLSLFTMSTANRTKKKKITASGKRTMLVIIGIVLLLMIVLLVIGHGLNEKISANQKRVEALEKLLQEEELNAEQIEELEEYMQSDEYLEQTAKEKLGMVKDGEIIFVEGD